MEKQMGVHLIAEVTNCDPVVLNDELYLHSLLHTACQIGGAGIVNSQSHKFSPQGVTVLILLSESHASIHTWPEDCYAAIDVFTCGTKVKPKMIIDYIQQKMDGSYHVKKIQRGTPGRK